MAFNISAYNRRLARYADDLTAALLDRGHQAPTRDEVSYYFANDFDVYSAALEIARHQSR